MNDKRRLILLAAISAMAGSASLAFAPALAGAALPLGSPTDTLRAVAAAAPQLGYHAAGPADGRPIVIALAHGQRPAQHAETAALLAAQGFHVLLPQLRAATAPELGQDLLGFLDRLHIPEAVFVASGDAAEAVDATAQQRRTRVVGRVLATHASAAASADQAPDTTTIKLAADATPQQIADAAARLARQGKWRT